MRTLDLGCGSNKTEGALGADLTKGSDADVIVNFDQFYYPFKDSSFDHIIFNHVIEQQGSYEVVVKIDHAIRLDLVFVAMQYQ